MDQHISFYYLVAGMIKAFVAYLKSIRKHWLWLIGGTLIGLIDYFFIEYGQLLSIFIFLIAFFPAQFLSRKEYYDLVENGYNLPPKHRSFLKELYGLGQDFYDYNDKDSRIRGEMIYKN